MMRNIATTLSLSLLLTAISACESEVQRGLAATDRSKPGPVIVWDPLAKPQPEIPFPNDLARTILADGTSRINGSAAAATKLERDERTYINEIEGFSGLTPISLSFDGPLDVSSVTDDRVYVLNVTPTSKRYLERMKIDLGRGWFVPKADPHQYLPLDPLKNFDSFVYPPDNKIDTDGDGVPDKWVYHYEVATHTLEIRPIMPLEPGAQYAIILTKGIKGWDKNGVYGPVQSPFDIVNHDTQTDALRLALPALQVAGVKTEDIAFAWTLTTGDLSRTFQSLRDGLYGTGPFAWLNAQFPPKIADIYKMDIAFDGSGTFPADKPYPFVANDHQWILQGEFMQRIFGLIESFQPGVAGTFKNVSHVVFGELSTVNLRGTVDNVWRLDLKSGAVGRDVGDGKVTMGQQAAKEQVPFLLIVPKPTQNHKPPFPVVIYAHATGTSRVESFLLADRLAQAGIATFAIDAVGHGPVLADPVKFLKGTGFLPVIRAALGTILFPDYDTRFPESMSDDVALKLMLSNGFVQQLAYKGRAVDDNGDCLIKGGEAYFAPNAFRLRDSMRQTTLDFMVAVRMLRALNQKDVPTPPKDPGKATKEQIMPSLIAGDFDCDGVLDVGGDVPYFMTGVSLGGIHTSLTSPLEPAIVAAAPVVPGAGLADIFIRTQLHFVVEPLMYTTSGPMVIACPLGDNKVRLSLNDESNGCNKSPTRKTYVDPTNGKCLDDLVDVPVSRGDVTVPVAARVTLTNLDNGSVRETKANADGSFRIAVPSDKGDRLRIDVFGAAGNKLSSTQMVTPYEGLAKERNTPDFRHFVQIAANVLEGADAITVANRVLQDPLPNRSVNWPATNMLMLVAIGDATVPFSTGMALARAIGLFGWPTDKNPEPFRVWMEQGIADNLFVDKAAKPTLLDATKPENGTGLCRTLSTIQCKSGDKCRPEVSALCLADVHGHHEYIAQAGGGDSFPPIVGADGKLLLDKAGKPYKGSYTEYHKNLIVNYFHSLAQQVGQDVCWGNAQCAIDQNLHATWALPIGTIK